jgi:glycosyltransferase involved in cell wall biosynthesis
MGDSRCLRIAMIAYFLPVVGRKVGGVDRVAHDLADGLARRGHQVVVWSYDPRPERARYDVRPLPFRRFARSWLGKRLTMGYLGNLLPLALDWRGADVILANGDSWVLPVLGKPVVRVMYGSALAEALSASSPWRAVHQLGVYFQELLTGFLQPDCVGISQNTRRHNPFVRRVIPLGIDMEKFFPDPAARATGPTILCVATLQGRKRGSLMLEWFTRHIRPRHPEASLWMVSTPGPELPGVRYFHGIDDAHLVRLYREAWVYASPSRYEGFGLPYVEAMASGTPVVASPNPGSREVLGEGRYGVLAEDAAFPAAVNALLGDAAARQEWTRRGLEQAREYSRSAMIDRYERLLLELTHGRRFPRRA